MTDADMQTVSSCDLEVPLHAGSACLDTIQLLNPCEHGFRLNFNSICCVRTEQCMPLAVLARRTTLEERSRFAA